MKRYVVGIDLGTTNCALAYVDPADRERRVRTFAVPQVVAEGDVALRPTLPSFLYLAGEHDVAAGSLALPWDLERDYVAGEFARRQGARVPGRLVSSAKSWLCHGGVDREAAILPWGGADDVAKLSPVAVSARYLQHLHEAWDHEFSDAPLERQDVILTVPASFDEVARELTVAAAEQAGLGNAVLLEEPLAAFYAWLHENETSWEEALEGVRLIVVIDVGGGTTDFTLVAVRRDHGRISLERLAVGDHLLLGGDNFDVALARHLEPRLGAKLDSQRWHAMVGQCCAAKETLLGEDAPDEVPVRVIGRGRAVVGGVLTATLQRQDVHDLLVEGFFPAVDAEAGPRRDTRVALQEWGLPFTTDPEVPRHLAAFLRQHAADSGSLAEGAGDGPANTREDVPEWPDAVLFNGGALKPRIIRERLRSQLASWSHREPRVLESVDLDLAVARGAAYYGLVRRGEGIRVAGGSARAYYLGIDANESGGGEPDARMRVLCLAHRGMQEGEQIEIDEPAFDVLANRAVSFPIFASSVRLGDRAGQMLEVERDSVTELPPIVTVLRFGKKLSERKLPVHVITRLTETGTMEIWFRSLPTEHRWRLQFQLRDPGAKVADEKAASTAAAESVVDEDALRRAVDAVREVFPVDSSPPPADPRPLVRTIEERLDTGKDAWPLPAIRQLWDELWSGRERRRQSAEHEARWLNLAGFLLRPGFGAETDDWRIQNLWRLRSEGLCHPRAAQCRAEWWNMWKRVAGGLSRQQQMQLHTEIAVHLLPRRRSRKAKATPPGPRPGPQELREYWQLLGSCERLPPTVKVELGDVLVAAVRKGKASEAEVWALGRLGARAPFHGPLNCVVERALAERWIGQLLESPWNKPAAIAFALVQLGRRVGDRERDVDPALRERLAERLRASPVGERGARLVTEIVALAAAERARVLDESLPVGLQLRDDAD